MNIMITGVAGGIGSTLGYQLHQKGHTIFGVDNFANGYKENLSIGGTTYCYKFFNTDIRNNSEIFNILITNKIDVIIHLAAITALPICEANPTESISVNVGGTASMLDAARRAGIKQFVFASTSAIYENNKSADAPFTENLPVSPRLIYPLSKKLAEDLCKSYETNYKMVVNVLRFFNVFGPRQDIHRKNPPLINYIVKEAIANRRPILHSSGLQQRDYIFVNDVTNLIELVINKPTSNVTINVSSGVLLGVQEIVKAVLEELNPSIIPIYQPADHFWDNYPILFDGIYPLDKNIIIKEVNKFSLGDNRLAKELFEWRPETDLIKMIKQTAREIKEKYDSLV